MIRTFADLLREAQQQSEPQRLLLVLCRAELPDDATEEERLMFERGQGGALVPAICVDKLASDIISFSALCEEAQEAGADWAMMFVGALSGRAGMAPSSDEAQQPLNMMVEAIQMGHVHQFLAINRQGDAVSLGQ